MSIEGCQLFTLWAACLMGGSVSPDWIVVWHEAPSSVLAGYWQALAHEPRDHLPATSVFTY